MSGKVIDSVELARLQAAADWLQRLHARPGDECLAMEWFDWCQADPENLRAFERMQATWQAFDDVRRRKDWAAAGPLRYRFAIAAGLVLAAGIAWWQFADYNSRSARTLTTDVAEHGSQILTDGSRVDLGARTRIATRYTSAQRAITLETGEAFFQVIKDARRPFVVRAGAVQVTAVGTAFSVRRTLDGTVVTVSEGAVLVAPLSVSAGHEIHAGAGDRVTFFAATNRLSVVQVDPGSATAWREGILKYVDEPLAAVVNDVNRYARQPIVLVDERLRRRLYTGTVYRDRIDDWLQALERVFPLEAKKDGTGQVTLTAK